MPIGVYKRFEGQRKKRGQKVPCIFCGAEVYVFPGKIGKGSNFCSKSCANRSNAKNLRRKKGEILSCHFCGEEVYIWPHLVKEGKNRYCSKKCSNIDHADLISLRNKGKKLSEETKSKLRKYSGEKASNWKGGRPKCSDCGIVVHYNSKHCVSCKTKHWTTKHRKKINTAVSLKLRGRIPKNIMKEGKFVNIKRGWFEINGKKMFFRSTWEANYAIYLEYLMRKGIITKWSYEEEVFIFHKIQTGTRSYRPDFKITNPNDSIEYHEVKGWLTPRSKTQINRMRIYYPKIKLIVIDQKCYDDIRKKMGKMLNFF